MSEKHVVGIKYTDQNSQALTFYIQQDYNSRFTKWIAWSIRDSSKGWGMEKSLFFTRFIAELLEYDSTSRISLSVPANDHTLHLVDVDLGHVSLFSSDGKSYKVGYTFEEFHNRVKA